MKKIIILFFLINCIGSNIFASDIDPLLYKYIDLYKNLEFKKALKTTENFNHSDVKKICSDLILIRTNSGQNPIDFDENVSSNRYSGEAKIIHLLSLGYFHLYKNLYQPKAFNYFQEAYTLSLKENAHQEIKKICLLAILDVYYLEVNKSSKEVLKYIEDLKKLSTDKADKFYVIFHQIRYYLRGFKSDGFPSKKLISSFKELIKKFDTNHSFWAHYYVTMGIIYRFSNKKEEAVNLFKKGLQTNKEYVFLRPVRYLCAVQLAETYRELKKTKNVFLYLKEAEQHINKADTLASQYGLNIYNSFYNYDIKNYKKAYELLKLASVQSIQLGYIKNASEISRLSVKYETERKEKELLKTKVEKATTQLKLNNQKQLTYGLLGGLALLLLGGYILAQRNKQKHQLVLSQEKEAGLQAIIQAEENERSKIARELHDGVVQQIGSVILNSRNILDKLNLLDKPESQELLKSLEDSNQDIRTISHQMMPRALEELGLIASLDDLLNSSLPLKGIKVNYEHFNINERLPQKIEKTLYRIVQELTNNILKHSQATEVSVQLFKTQNNIMLIVEDNGIGMKPQKTKGIGLLNINSRLDMVHGTVNFEPSPESGTLVTIKIPLT